MIFITWAQYVNISAQILNYAEYHRKSESGAFASFFGREEWIENPVPDCFGDAYTIVGNGDLNLIVSLMGCHEHFAACRAGIACVVHKVHHDLQQFLRVTENVQALIALRADPDFLALFVQRDQGQGFLHALAYIDDLLLIAFQTRARMRKIYQ